MPAEQLANAPEFTVSELSSALKRTVEDAYGHVRVRGEISGFRGPHSIVLPLFETEKRWELWFRSHSNDLCPTRQRRLHSEVLVLFTVAHSSLIPLMQLSPVSRTLRTTKREAELPRRVATTFSN